MNLHLSKDTFLHLKKEDLKLDHYFLLRAIKEENIALLEEYLSIFDVYCYISLQTLERRGYIAISEGEYKPTEKGITFLEQLENQ